MDTDSDEFANELYSNRVDVSLNVHPRRSKRKKLHNGMQVNLCESDDGDFSNDDDQLWLPNDSKSTKNDLIVDPNQNENHLVGQTLVTVSTENSNDSLAAAESNDSITATRESNNSSRSRGKYLINQSFASEMDNV